MDNLRLRCYSSIDDLKKDIKVKSASELVEGDKIYGYVAIPPYGGNSGGWQMLANIHFHQYKTYPFYSQFENIDMLIKQGINEHSYSYNSVIEYPDDFTMVSYQADIPSGQIHWFSNPFNSATFTEQPVKCLYMPVYFSESDAGSQGYDPDNNPIRANKATTYKVQDEWDYDNQEIKETYVKCLKDGYITFIRWPYNAPDGVYFVMEPYSA